MNAISKICLTVALLMPATTLVQITTAQAGGLDCLGCSVCPKCDHCCTLSVDKVDVDKHCWKVECKQICVPHIVFPWQKPDCCGGCVDNGAHVKTVKVLVKHSYTCPACEYTWTPRNAGCCGSCGHGNRCGNHHGKSCGNHHGHGCGSDCDSACCDGLKGIEMGPSVPTPAPIDDYHAPQPYDQPVHAEPAPSVLEASPEAAPAASLFQAQKVQAVGFMRELLSR